MWFPWACFLWYCEDGRVVRARGRLDDLELGQLFDPVLDELLLREWNAELRYVNWLVGLEVDAVLHGGREAEVHFVQRECVVELEEQVHVALEVLRRRLDVELAAQGLAALRTLSWRQGRRRRPWLGRRLDWRNGVVGVPELLHRLRQGQPVLLRRRYDCEVAQDVALADVRQGGRGVDGGDRGGAAAGRLHDARQNGSGKAFCEPC